ncbi:hypothetical protein BGZ60DRAFT_371763 [Tricladium varicosporioides]|nr:hypothetical protein BGZ60DRAFT_371763 [Hymenoscyphus varicosporioides]
MWLSIPTEARSRNLFERASTCPDPAYTQCANTQLPDNFCCPATSKCIALAANTTLLCCPQGGDCQAIQPIPCDINMQNITAHPDNILKTTALSVKLQTCSNACCPFGYTCSGTVCIQNAKQDVAPGATPTATSSSVSIVPTSSSTVSPNTGNNATTLPTQSCNKFPVGAILVGFFPGLVLGILLTIASICFIGINRRGSSSDRRRSGSSFGNISEPQLTSSSDMRTDFLRKPPQTPSTTAAGTPSRSGTVKMNRVRSLFRKSGAPSQESPMTMTNSNAHELPRAAPPMPLSLQVQRPKEQARPVTPRLQREPSYEDINIFADGDTASALRERQLTPEVNGNRGGYGGLGVSGGVGNRISHQTTFTDMMESSGLAGLQKGQREF